MKEENKSVIEPTEAQETLVTLAEVFVEYLCSDVCASPEWHEKVRLCWTNCSLMLKERIQATEAA